MAFLWRDRLWSGCAALKRDRAKSSLLKRDRVKSMRLRENIDGFGLHLNPGNDCCCVQKLVWQIHEVA